MWPEIKMMLFWGGLQHIQSNPNERNSLDFRVCQQLLYHDFSETENIK